MKSSQYFVHLRLCYNMYCDFSTGLSGYTVQRRAIQLFQLTICLVNAFTPVTPRSSVMCRKIAVTN